MDLKLDALSSPPRVTFLGNYNALYRLGEMAMLIFLL